jgi:hypothetical protein
MVLVSWTGGAPEGRRGKMPVAEQVLKRLQAERAQREARAAVKQNPGRWWCPLSTDMPLRGLEG